MHPSNHSSTPLCVCVCVCAVAALEPPPLPPFDVASVLAALAHKDYVPPEALLERFGGQRGLLQFYERLLRSPNLIAFVHMRRLAAEEWQRQEWAAAAAAVRAPMAELMTVESFYLLEQQLAAARQQHDSSHGSEGGGADGGQASSVQHLQQELRSAFSELPEDLQQAILNTPAHAELLGAAAG